MLCHTFGLTAAATKRSASRTKCCFAEFAFSPNSWTRGRPRPQSITRWPPVPHFLWRYRILVNPSGEATAAGEREMGLQYGTPAFLHHNGTHHLATTKRELESHLEISCWAAWSIRTRSSSGTAGTGSSRRSLKKKQALKCTTWPQMWSRRAYGTRRAISMVPPKRPPPGNLILSRTHLRSTLVTLAAEEREVFLPRPNVPSPPSLGTFCRGLSPF